MKHGKDYLEAVIILFILVTLLVVTDSVTSPKKQMTLYFEGGSFVVEIVDTPRARAQGLSGREALVPQTGMLFIFPRDDYHGIWMKDMNFPIDIVWIDVSGRIVDIKHNIHPETYPEVFKPARRARFVLEIPAGSVDNSGLEVGEGLDLSEVREVDF